MVKGLVCWLLGEGEVYCGVVTGFDVWVASN